MALADAVAALRRYSLIRVVADGIYVHRLLQTVIRDALDADAGPAWAATAVRLLRGGFPSKTDEVTSWPECQRLLPHALAVADHGQRLDVESELWLWLVAQSATYLWRQGLYRQALTLDERVLAARRRLHDEEHPDTLRSMNNLAETRRDLGDLDGARQLHEQVLAASRRVLGEEHPNTLNSMNNLRAVRRDLGEL
jgi:tetratricopeptide (TPR) repeat protein